MIYTYICKSISPYTNTYIYRPVPISLNEPRWNPSGSGLRLLQTVARSRRRQTYTYIMYIICI